MTEYEQVIRELQKSQVSLSDRLSQQKQRLIELCGISCVLDPDFVNLQDTKDRVRSAYLVLHYNTTIHATLKIYCKCIFQCCVTSILYV